MDDHDPHENGPNGMKCGNGTYNRGVDHIPEPVSAEQVEVKHYTENCQPEQKTCEIFLKH